MAAISYKIFGITGFAYKLPAFLFWLLSLRYTYLIARDLYNEDVAKIAVLIYTVALHSTLANFDVRAEPYLTACITGAAWHMLRVHARAQWKHIVWAALFAACAIMTKGVFVLITLAGGWAIYWLITAQFREFLNYRFGYAGCQGYSRKRQPCAGSRLWLILLQFRILFSRRSDTDQKR